MSNDAGRMFCITEFHCLAGAAFQRTFSKTQRVRAWRSAAAAAAALLGPIAALSAQSEPATPGDPTVAALSKQVAQMEAEIQDLKRQLGAVKTGEATAEASEPAPDQSYPRISFHGFGDVDYQYSSDSKAFPNLFSLGELDFYVTSQISENASILSENVLSADSTFNNWNLEAERLVFIYKVSPYLNIAAGRFHTEMGYYNTEFHHGTWLQMDTHRPWFLEFEDSGGILPVHMVGISLDGDIPSASANLHYFLQFGNGRSYDAPNSPENPTQADHVDNGRKAVNVEIV